MNCKQCGKRISKAYTLCWECNQRKVEREQYRSWLDKSEEEKELEREQYYNTECDMCGKEGADRRSDGRNYCGTCWQVWNS